MREMAVVGVSSSLALKSLGRCTALIRHHCVTFRRIAPLSICPNLKHTIFNRNNLTRNKFTTSSTIAALGEERDNTASVAETLEEKHTTTTVAVAESDSDKDRNLVREAANTLDIRVGRIVRAWKHEEADSLYVEEIDIGGGGTGDGEGEPHRIICSGLVKYISLDYLQERKVVVFANLKPRNMRGVKSFGMLLAASDSSHENVELLEPPESSLPGDRIWFGDVDEKENLPDVASPNQVQKKKIWELVQPHLKTNASCEALLGESFMRTSAGVVRCRSLKDANIS